MATTNIIQRLTDGDSADVLNRSQRERFRYTGVITAGDWVALDVSQTGADRALFVKRHDGASPELTTVVGVALQGTADLDEGENSILVCVGGYAEDAKVNAAVAQGDLLIPESGAAGTAVAVTGTNPQVVGVALEAHAGGTADVWVFKQF